VKGESVFLEYLKNLLKFWIFKGNSGHFLTDIEFELEGRPNHIIFEIVGLTHHSIGFLT
jgi:hypothetical protein